ncbi:MAG: hypothetical protein WC683_19275 [bacterium]
MSDYTTQAKLKSSLGIQSTSTYADEDIDLAITAASRAIDNLTHRYFYLHDASNDEVFYYSPSSRLQLEIHDLVTLTSLKLDTDGNSTFETTLTVNTDFVLEPLNAVEESRPWERVRIHPNGSYALPAGYPRSVEVTGRFGWTTTPYEVEQACQILAAQLLKRTKDSAVYGFVSLPGIEINQVARIGRSDPHIMALLDPFIKKTYLG